MSTIETLTCVLTQTMIRCVYTVRKFYTGLYRSHSVDALCSCCARKTTFPLMHISRITDGEFYSKQKCTISHISSFMFKNKKTQHLMAPFEGNVMSIVPRGTTNVCAFCIGMSIKCLIPTRKVCSALSDEILMSFGGYRTYLVVG